MSVTNGNHILFCFEHSYYISPNKIGILLHHEIETLFYKIQKKFEFNIL